MQHFLLHFAQRKAPRNTLPHAQYAVRTCLRQLACQLFARLRQIRQLARWEEIKVLRLSLSFFMIFAMFAFPSLHAQAGKIKIIQVGCLNLAEVFALIEGDPLLRFVLEQGASEDLLEARELDQKIMELQNQLLRDTNFTVDQKSAIEDEIAYYREELSYLLGSTASVNLEGNAGSVAETTLPASVLRELYRVVRQVAQREGYSLILEQGVAVIYWEEQLDITPLVKAELLKLKNATN